MLTHKDLADYVEGLNDPELLEFAAHVTAWRLLLQGTEYDDTRQLVIRALVAVSNEFGIRGLNKIDPNKSWINPESPWGRAHARAAMLRADSTPERARAQIVAWARTVRLVGGALEICPERLGTGELPSVPQVVELMHPDGETMRVLIAGED